MNTSLKLLCLSGAALLALTGCSSDDANSHDLTGVPWKTPDKIEVYSNVDMQPNIVRLCIGGVAFATTSRGAGLNFLRVPEWDVPFCGGKASPYFPQVASGADARPTPEAK